MTFQETGLNEALCLAVEELGFVNPTAIQEKTIPHILNHEDDLIALSQTGSGKTAAFSLPILEKMFESKTIQTLILCPTRELCRQISSDIRSYSKNLKNIKSVPVYGGASIQDQIRDIRRGANIIIGTPGRVLDLLNKRVLDFSQIKWLVLDEADEMLNMGFKDELDQILKDAPKEKQTLLFSATMSRDIKRIAMNYMRNPEEFTIGKQNQSSTDVSHEFYEVHARDRYQALKRIIDHNPSIYGIVFCRTRKETKDIADNLMADGYNADSLHGDLSQSQRDYVMQRFRTGQLQLLIATDVAARGLDVNNLTHVINFNLPDDLEVYVHRSGRTGRAGNKGISISIIHMKEKGKIRQLEKLAKTKFDRKLIPSGKDICESQLFHLIEKVHKIEVNHEQIDPFLPSIYKELESLSREELIQHFVSAEFNRFLNYYENKADINVSESQRSRNDSREGRDRGRDGGKRRAGSPGMSRFFVNIGFKDDLIVTDIIQMVKKASNQRNIEIGRIDMKDSFSFFEADSKFDKELLEGMKKITLKNDRKLNIEFATESPGRDRDSKRSGFNNKRKPPHKRRRP